MESPYGKHDMVKIVDVYGKKYHASRSDYNNKGRNCINLYHPRLGRRIAEDGYIKCKCTVIHRDNIAIIDGCRIRESLPTLPTWMD